MENKISRPVHKKNSFLIVTVVISVLALVILGLLAFSYTYMSDTISKNIYVNSIYLGELTDQEATEILEDEIDESYFDKMVNIKYKDRTFAVNLAEFVKIDAKKTAETALKKSGNIFEKLMNKEKLVLPFELEVDYDGLREHLLDFSRDLESEVGTFVFDDKLTEVDVDSSKLTEIIDTQNTMKNLCDNASNDVFADIDAVVVNLDQENYPEELYNVLRRPERDASIGMNEDESTYLIPERIGVEIEKSEFLDLFKKQDGKFRIAIKTTEPKIKMKDLDIEFYQDVLGQYTSAYDVGLVNRTKNLSLAARLVNGTIIMPGKRFSYNAVVGPRTYERGFLDATVYTGEGTEEGVGGGICQVSSTIYCAQLRADLKTVSRTNHSYTIVYVPLGQDATVVYGALDYIFENNTNYPIKIIANANGGYLTVKIMGTKIDKTKRVDVVSVTEYTTPKGEVTQEDPTLPEGETTIKQNGQTGAVVSTYKVYYKNDVEQSREFVSKSTYKPMNKIILVGTLKPEDQVESQEPDETEDPQNPDEEIPNDDEQSEDAEDVDAPQIPQTPEGEEDQEDPEEPPEVLTSDTGI